MENAIHVENAARIRAHLIVEAPNGPVTFQADQMLRSRGVTILPDLYVNAGGVIVSYFESVKNLTHIPFGLMERRRRERRNQTIATALERMTGQPFPADMRDEFLEGGAEIDLVRSGLEDAMRSTWSRIADLLEEQPDLGDYRTALCGVNSPTHMRLLAFEGNGGAARQWPAAKLMCGSIKEFPIRSRRSNSLTQGAGVRISTTKHFCEQDLQH